MISSINNEAPDASPMALAQREMRGLMMNGDGSNIHQIGYNTQFEGRASLMPDGRILCIYCRTDLPGLWAQLARLEGDDWINLDGQKGGSPSTLTEVYAGTFDDGSNTVGISGITSTKDAGINVVDVGESRRPYRD